MILERCYAQNMGGGAYKSNLPDNLEIIKTVGYEHVMVDTDGGQTENPHWELALEEYMQYLADHGIRILGHIGLAVLIGAVNMTFPIYPEHRAAFLPLRSPQLAAQVDIPGIQQTCINIGIDGAVRDRQFIPIPFANGRKGLSLFQQG